MQAQPEKLQRIARLTPLADVLAQIASLGRPVAPQNLPPESALGRTLATDATVARERPEMTLALRDGWAVCSDDMLDAGATAPVPLVQPPSWLDAGEPLPRGADALAPPDAIVWQGDFAEGVAPVTPGEGVLTAGADAAVGAVLRPAGRRLRHTDVAVLQAASIDRVAVRLPRVRVHLATASSPILESVVSQIAGLIAADGGMALRAPETEQLERALRDDVVDAVCVIGGTGSGRRDESARALSRAGRLAVHGVAINPGETAGFGEVDGRPVLLLPGRIDAALAVWLLLGRPLLAALCGGTETDNACEAVLRRKVSSQLGLAEVVPVRRTGETVEPLASGYLPLAALSGADGWILVPADSEGHPAGARVKVRPLP